MKTRNDLANELVPIIDRLREIRADFDTLACQSCDSDDHLRSRWDGRVDAYLGGAIDALNAAQIWLRQP